MDTIEHNNNEDDIRTNVLSATKGENVSPGVTGSSINESDVLRKPSVESPGTAQINKDELVFAHDGRLKESSVEAPIVRNNSQQEQHDPSDAPEQLSEPEGTVEVHFEALRNASDNNENEDVNSSDQNSSDHEDTGTNVSLNIDELPDNLYNDDFSKLLEFDSKNDDVLFNDHNILNHDIATDDINKDISLIDPQVSATLREHTEEDVDQGKDGSSPRDTTVNGIEENDNKSEGNSHSSDDAIEKQSISEDIEKLTFKESTVSPTQGTPVKATEHETLNDDANDASPRSKSTGDLEVNKDTPASIIHEKNNLLYPHRNNSLTPGTFKPHELSNQNIQNSNLDVNTKEGQIAKSGQTAPDSNINPSTTINTTIPEEQPTIFAYARLDFQSFTFYVQTLHAIIGRRSENDFTHKVDVNLGPSKSISRRHAQIFYNFGTGRFELSIIGKNGAFVDDVFVERGNTVPLKNKTKIQIGQIPFQFVLPESEKSPAAEKITDSTSTKAAKAAVKKEPKVKTEPSQPKKKQPKPAAKKEKKPAKVPKKVYTIDEIPVEYRTKPTFSYSAMLTTCIRKYSTEKGMSLSEIYSGIRELFPYYKYCPDGWQSSVRHNLSLNKSFRKVSKEGKGWLWGLDEEYIAERERQKKKQAETAAAKAQAAQLRIEQQQQQQKARPKKTVKANNNTNSNDTKKQNISQTLAANRARASSSNQGNDHQRTMKYLQEQLMILTKDRKGLPKQTIANILTQALAMTINQVTQAAKNKGITGNPLTALMDKNPQHLNLILAAAVNAATAKITNGKIKQLVDPKSTTTTTNISKPVSKPTKSTSKSVSPGVSTEKVPIVSANEPIRPSTASTAVPTSTPSFDPTSLSRFFQPRQQATRPTHVTTPSPTPPLMAKNNTSIPQKRTHDETSSSEGESSSDDNTSDDDDDEEDSSGDESSEDESSEDESSGSESGENNETVDDGDKDKLRLNHDKIEDDTKLEEEESADSNENSSSESDDTNINVNDIAGNKVGNDSDEDMND
ncbi:hypothetical protein KAFR_0D04220 [Kazachstania africana CBS 2517]|uniref:Pre-rRNA-processing protein FHL1 n=1 Tax=Kazachstania africana (strain ATCC 22294 / BCRC 22015 / CBS 2517 / CECT 1963 / NBRC 1671 / NRRL Y-8276) TaxID=1071382 RepID=H2AUM0_KAZAF|nr:hypothetical protein KAFR_0D04220 [Kazachstania africana CBS 2517]CCF58070.1 hypothetical protein KAFR_0D04220 [Kazachstania africana CBS 2517]